jgi:serine/threonine protein kinase
MILKFYTGGSLSDFIKKTSFTARVDVKILREIASGLSVMHSHYLAHCDMKPQNVLVEILDNVPSIAISDFGITRILSDKILASKQFNVRSTKGLSVHYAAPEAFTSFRSKDYVRTDFKKCDVYSFSCILYEMLGRRFPWNQ